MVYLHGGAYVRGIVRLALALPGPGWPTPSARGRCCRRTRVAPEFTVEDSFEEMVALVEEVLAESPDGVVLAGDSAGGGYALAVAEALRDRGGPQPDHLVLIAPWVDLTGSAPGHPRGRRARPVALLRAPVDLRLVLGRLGGSRPRSRTRG